jgi:methionine-S-sulfoxide reductase
MHGKNRARRGRSGEIRSVRGVLREAARCVLGESRSHHAEPSGPDVGTQYRSAIFYHTPEQKREAEESKAELEASHRFRKPIVTEITEASAFYPAEDYHQRYLEKRGLATCHI